MRRSSASRRAAATAAAIGARHAAGARASRPRCCLRDAAPCPLRPLLTHASSAPASLRVRPRLPPRVPSDGNVPFLPGNTFSDPNVSAPGPLLSVCCRPPRPCSTSRCALRRALRPGRAPGAEERADRGGITCMRPAAKQLQEVPRLRLSVGHADRIRRALEGGPWGRPIAPAVHHDATLGPRQQLQGGSPRCAASLACVLPCADVCVCARAREPPPLKQPE